jgi:hypothetical protein
MSRFLGATFGTIVAGCALSMLLIGQVADVNAERAVTLKQQAASAGADARVERALRNDDSAGQPTPPEIAVMSASAQSKQLELSRDDIQKFRLQSSADSKSGAKFLEHCNDAKYRQSEGQDFTGNTLTINDAGRMCGLWADAALKVLGPANPEVALAFQRACFLTSTVSPNQRTENYCAELGDLYVQRGDLDTALAVYQGAPNCNLEFSGAGRETLCLLGERNIFVLRHDIEGERSTVNELCAKYNIYALCIRLNNLGGSADLNAVRARNNADAEAAKKRVEDQDKQWARRQLRQHDAATGPVVPSADDASEDIGAGPERPSHQVNSKSSQTLLQTAAPSDLAGSSQCVVHQIVVVGPAITQHQFTNVCSDPIDFLYFNNHPSPGDNNNSTGVLYPGKSWLADLTQARGAMPDPIAYKMFFCEYPDTPTSQNPQPSFSNPGTVSCRGQN